MIKSEIPYLYEIDKLQTYKFKPKTILPERNILNYTVYDFAKPKAKETVKDKKIYTNIDIKTNKRKLKPPTFRYKKPDLESFKNQNI